MAKGVVALVQADWWAGMRAQGGSGGKVPGCPEAVFGQ